MTRKTRITRRGIIIVLAMAMPIVSVTSGQGLPDLDAWNVTFSPTTVSPGQAFQMNCTMHNLGTEDAGAFIVEFYASTDTTISTSDYYIGQVAVPGLPVGRFEDYDWNGSFPGGIPAGEYYVGIIADPDNQVEEYGEDNNTKCQKSYKLTVLSVRTVTISSTEGGSVTSPGEGQFEYDHGTDVTLVATADPGYHFTHWSGSVWSTSNPHHLTVDHDYDVKANFEPGEPPGPVQLQACCLPDGSCLHLTPEECIAQGGLPQGEGTSCATITCPASPALGPVAHWKLDESSGTIAEDSAGGNDGTTYGGPVWLPAGGMMDGALAFDGVDDYVSLPIGSVIHSLTNSTFATWVDFANTGGPWQRIFDFGNNTTAYMFLTPRRGTTGEMRFGMTIQGGGAPEQLVTAPRPLPSGWHHVAVTIDADNDTVNLYLDGIVVASNTAVTLTPSDLGHTTNNWLGRSQYSADAYFDGSLDDFRIYDYALSAAQIVKLLCIDPPLGDVTGDCRFDFADLAILFSDWLTWKAGDCDQLPVWGLVAHWKLDESSGTIAEDSAGYNDGTTYGGPVWLPAGGMMDGALAFDGVDDYVSLPIGSVIHSLTNSTFATWVDFADTGGPWQRIFDFGSNTTAYMFLTPRRDTAGEMRFGMTIQGGGAPEQLVTAPRPLPSGWHHVAVTIDADSDTVNLYLDGIVVASNTAVTLTPSDLGHTTNNWLGRSQYSWDAYYSGMLDDFRIYDYALSAAQIVRLLCIDPPPGDVNGDFRFDLSDLAILFSNWRDCTIPVGDFCEQPATPRRR